MSSSSEVRTLSTGDYIQPSPSFLPHCSGPLDSSCKEQSEVRQLLNSLLPGNLRCGHVHQDSGGKAMQGFGATTLDCPPGSISAKGPEAG